jgi:hypothetical protein
MTLEGGFTLQRSLPRRVAGGNTLVRGDLGWQTDEMEQPTVDCNGPTVKAFKPAQLSTPILVVLHFQPSAAPRPNAAVAAHSSGSFHPFLSLPIS